MKGTHILNKRIVTLLSILILVPGIAIVFATSGTNTNHLDDSVSDSETSKTDSNRREDSVRASVNDQVARSKYPQVARLIDSPYVVEYETPTRDSAPFGIAVAPDGTIWFTEDDASNIGSFDPATETFTEFPLPTKGLGLWYIAVDNQGIVWFTETTDPPNFKEPAQNVARIGRLDPTNGSIVAYDIPTQDGWPTYLAIDAGGNIWFSELGNNKIGKLNPSTGTIVEFETPTRGHSGPAAIAFDSGGNVWVTEAFASKVAFLNVSSMTWKEFDFPSLRSPVGVAVDSMGDVWIADHGSNIIAKFSPQDGSLERFATARASDYPVSIPNGLLIAPDGTIWSAVHGANRIAQFFPSSNTFVEYVIPTGPITDTLWLALAADGKVWFAESNGDQIGFVDPSLSIPFTFEASERIMKVQAGEKTSLQFHIGTERSVSALTLNVTGSIFNYADVEYSFDPNPVLIGPEDKVMGTFTVEIATGFTFPGPDKHRVESVNIAISATDGKVVRTISLKLIVET